MIIASVTSDYGIGKGIADITGMEYLTFSSKTFPDGESYLNMGRNLKGEDILLVQGMDTVPDKRFVETLMAIDAAFEAGAGNVYGLITYMAYARQDRAFTEGEPISARAILKALYNAGMQRLAVVEPHKAEELSYFKGKSNAISVLEDVAVAASNGLKNPIIIAPDAGSYAKADRIAKALGTGCDYIQKKRNRIDGSVSMEKGLDNIEGRDALIVDDMISTGGTIVQAANETREKGANRIYAAATHLVLAGEALRNIKGAGVSDVLGSNCIVRDGCRVVDVSKHIADTMQFFGSD